MLNSILDSIGNLKGKDVMKQVPIVFSVDDNYAPLLGVALQSIKETKSNDFVYNIHILNTGIGEENIKKLYKYNQDNMCISFVDVSKELKTIADQICLRDYYTATTYYRFFIPQLFPQYEKVLYLDCDIVLLDDVAKLYNHDIDGCLLGAIPEDIMPTEQAFTNYVEQGLGINVRRYFSAGIILINCKEFRSQNVLKQLIDLMAKFKFEVTQDEDYLNVICKDKVKYIEAGWNRAPIPNDGFKLEDVKLVHYKINYRPWKYDNVLYGNYFWDYAKRSDYYDYLTMYKNNYSDENKTRDANMFVKLVERARQYITRDDCYYKVIRGN